VAETSRFSAEFRLAVVGHLVVGDLDRGQLGAELKSLSAKKWKHPITGARVTFGYSTIERWYYIVLNNPNARLRALSKRRRDAGLPSSLTKQVRRYLASQAKRHSSWSCCRHHQTLVRHMTAREGGRPPGYSTVRRYLQLVSSSQNVAVDAQIKRLEGLVVHLRRCLSSNLL
jgi:putative transposase